ncbi:hypothetical protein [Streptomyces sp. NPDC005046]
MVGFQHAEEAFVGYIHCVMPALDRATIRHHRHRRHDLGVRVHFLELTERTGDDFQGDRGRLLLHRGPVGYSAQPPVVVELEGDHHGVLKAYGVGELFRRIRAAVAGQIC